MSGPWEKFANPAQPAPAAAEVGPWLKFQQQEAIPAPGPAVAPISKGERFAQGLQDPINAGAQLLTKVLPDSVVKAGNDLNNWIADKTGLVAKLPEGGVDQQIRENEAQYEARRAASGNTGVDWMRMAGKVVNPATILPGVAITKALPAAASLGARVLAGAAGGGASSLFFSPITEGEDFAAEKAKQTAVGAALGGLFPAVAAGVGRVISPKASTDPALKLLQSEGVNPTIGQTLGGVANRVEEKAMSLPFVGDSIAAARKRAAAELNTAVANRALGPVGKTLPPGVTGREAVDTVKTALGDAYDALLPRMTVKADGQFIGNLNSLRQMVATGSLDPNAVKLFNRVLQNDVAGKFKGQTAITGQTLKDIEGDLSQQISRLGASTDADQRLVGDALKEVQSALRELAARNNPALAKELKAINTGYAGFKRLEKAAGYIGAEDGVFSPAQLQSAVKALDRSKDKGAFARGDAFMQDLSDAAKAKLGDKVPNSGTADRLFQGAAVGASLASPAVPAAGLIGSAAYTPLGQALLRMSVASRPQSAQQVAALLNQASPMLGPAGGLFALQGQKN